MLCKSVDKKLLKCYVKNLSLAVRNMERGGLCLALKRRPAVPFAAPPTCEVVTGSRATKTISS